MNISQVDDGFLELAYDEVGQYERPVMIRPI